VAYSATLSGPHDPSARSSEERGSGRRGGGGVSWGSISMIFTVHITREGHCALI